MPSSAYDAASPTKETDSDGEADENRDRKGVVWSRCPVEFIARSSGRWRGSRRWRWRWRWIDCFNYYSSWSGLLAGKDIDCARCEMKD